MWEPALKDGRAAPSARASSKLATSCASCSLRTTRTARLSMLSARTLRRRPSCRLLLLLWLFLRDHAIDHAAGLHAARVDVQRQQLAAGIPGEVGLLGFQHREVLREHPGLTIANLGRERLVARVEVARHAPEVPHRSFGFGREEVHHDG